MDKVRSLATLGITVLIVSLTSACGRSTDKDRGVPVPNGGFENGTMEPWMPFQSVRAALDSNQVHSGKFSLAESAAKGSVYQDVRGLAPGVRLHRFRVGFRFAGCNCDCADCGFGRGCYCCDCFQDG